MKRLFKCKKGMSLIEVMLALAVLGLLTVPVMTAFMNTQIYAKKVDKQTEVSAITRTVKQIVADGFLGNVQLKAFDGSIVNIYNNVYTGDNSIPDTFKDFIEYAKKFQANNLIATSYLQICETNMTPNTKYKYTISYKHNDFYNATYPNVYNLLITVYDSKGVVNKIKFAVKV